MFEVLAQKKGGDPGYSLCMALCSPNKNFFAYHGANHGDTFQTNADVYFTSSNHVALLGSPANGRVVDAKSTAGCVDNWQGFGCKH